MARRQPPAAIAVDPTRGRQDLEFLQAMATDLGGDDKTRARAKLIVAMIKGADLATAAAEAGIGIGTAREKVQLFNAGGWQSLLTVMAPRGGDFLARYDQGFWAERLAVGYLDRSRTFRAVPYGTSRSEPFHDMQTFRKYVENEFLLQAWSKEGRWKRPDVLMLPRDVLRAEKGNDTWTPDLQHLDNNHCRPYVERAKAAVEVEMSLWQVKRATIPLSFTVKEEDLESLRNWVRANTLVPLYILQVFYDCAYALGFTTLEEVIGAPATNSRHVPARVDRYTKKNTYFIPLSEGVLLGEIPEPDVEGKVFKAPNGRVTVYGRLTGSAIDAADMNVLEQLAAGTLKTGRDEAAAAVQPAATVADEQLREEPQGEDEG